MSRQRIVIVGGGSAGITVAARLVRSRRDLDIALVEPSDKHYYQPLWTLVGAGVVDKRVTERDLADFIPQGVRWIRERAVELRPDENRVRLESGEELAYDALVLAPGIVVDWDAVEGLRETIGRNGVCSNYAFDQADYTWACLRGLAAGRAVFTNPSGQVKCGGAPQKIMYLADDHLRRRGVRERVEVVGAFAGTKLLGVPEINETLERIVEERDIRMRFHHDLVKVDGAAKVATFRHTRTGEAIDIPFDVIHVTPPMRAP